jgi:hypothetical protein|tara:strand:- start:241 stop:417 length:177 start_codon:yes stop_codon:yes gene_type:complete
MQVNCWYSKDIGVWHWTIASESSQMSGQSRSEEEALEIIEVKTRELNGKNKSEMSLMR